MRPRIAVDATPAVHAVVLAGAGLSVLPDYLVAADLAAGRLVRVLPTWKLKSGGIHILLPSARYRPAKVSRFVELMARAEVERSSRYRPQSLDQEQQTQVRALWSRPKKRR
jgi:DNA-binding transcriptional LysR family regulator